MHTVNFLLTDSQNDDLREAKLAKVYTITASFSKIWNLFSQQNRAASAAALFTSLKWLASLHSAVRM
jgi:hypothetical protein